MEIQYSHTLDKRLQTGEDAGLFLGPTIPFFFFTIVVFAARMYSRMRPWNIHWDDILIAIAFVFETTAYCMTLRIWAVTRGNRIAHLSFEEIEEGLYYSFINGILLVWINVIIKCSVSAMLLHIKNTFWWKIGLGFLMAACISFGIGGTIAWCIACRPTSAFWSISGIIAGKCWSTDKLLIVAYTLGVFFTVTDVIVALLPIAFIHKINRPVREKVILAILMGAGIFAAACGIAKTVLNGLWRNDVDFFHNLTLLGTFLHLEVLVGIIAASIPTLRSLFSRFLGRVKRTTDGNTYASTHKSSSSVPPERLIITRSIMTTQMSERLSMTTPAHEESSTLDTESV